MTKGTSVDVTEILRVSAVAPRRQVWCGEMGSEVTVEVKRKDRPLMSNR